MGGNLNAVGAGDAVEVMEGGDVEKGEGEAGETTIEVVDETANVEEDAVKGGADGEEKGAETVVVKAEEEGAEENGGLHSRQNIHDFFDAAGIKVINLFFTFIYKNR